ncbi:hypothetical protein LZ554_004745 [Drepanopeziza brunnea f. sp. 'monogermtubi']|nr:hypothetical protein LZ554_004745 [Drepanopeziza brunnea f. sp. 'monogermtubi']
MASSKSFQPEACDDCLTLSEEELRLLRDEKVILSGPTNGRWQVPVSILGPASSDPSQHLSFEALDTSGGSSPSANVTVRFQASNLSAKIQQLELPKRLESVEALECIGLTPEGARIIFDRWEKATRELAPIGSGTSLLDFVKGDLLRLNMLPWRDMPVSQAMTALFIRRGQPSQNTAKENCRIRLVHDEAEKELLSHSSVLEESPPALPGDRILYKSVALLDNESLVCYNGDGYIAPDEDRHGQGGTDFSRRNHAVYPFPDRDTAEAYRKWSATRCPWTATLLVRVQIPHAVLDTVRREQMWYSEPWKEWVWASRNLTADRSVPETLGRLRPQGDEILAVEGHICARAPAAVPRMDREEFHRIAGEDVLLLHIGGEKAVQVAFTAAAGGGCRALDLSEDLTRKGLIHVEIYPPLALSG